MVGRVWVVSVMANPSGGLVGSRSDDHDGWTSSFSHAGAAGPLEDDRRRVVAGGVVAFEVFVSTEVHYLDLASIYARVAGTRGIGQIARTTAKHREHRAVPVGRAVRSVRHQLPALGHPGSPRSRPWC